MGGNNIPSKFYLSKIDVPQGPPHRVELYPIESDKQLEIVPGKAYPDWMVKHKHACRCTPMPTANRFGWDILLDEDLEVEITVDENGDDHADVLKGPEHSSAHFGIGTVTLSPGYTWKTAPGVQLMVIPVPNQFTPEWTTLSAIIETDMLRYPWFLTLKFMKHGINKIKAGTPIARVIPVSVDGMVNGTITLANEPEEYKNWREPFSDHRIEIEKKETDDGLTNWTRVYAKNARHSKTKTPLVQAGTYVKDGVPKDELTSNNIFHIDDLLTPEQCEFLRNSWRNGNLDADDPNWGDMAVIEGIDWGDTRALLQDKLVAKAEEFYNTKLIPHDLHLVRWGPGKKMEPHFDTGQEQQLECRHIAAICYLSDDYEGGDLYFPDIGDLAIRADAGTAVMFPGSHMKHGVHEVTKGFRYTAVQWLEIVDG